MKKYIRYTVILLAAVSIQAAGIAQDSLKYYLQLAALNNPDVKARYLEFSAALEKVPQAGSLQTCRHQSDTLLNPCSSWVGTRLQISS